VTPFFFEHTWVAPAVWTLLYISDHTLTIWCARLYRRQEKIAYEGSFELNPIFQREVDSLRWVSVKFLAALILTNALLALILLLDKPVAPGLLTFALGAIVSSQLAIHVRHFRNLYVFSVVGSPVAARGRIEYSRPFVLHMSAVDLLAFSGMFALLYVFTSSWFVLGGASACFFLAGKHWWLARRRAARTGA